MLENRNYIENARDLIENWSPLDPGNDQTLHDWKYIQGSEKIRALSRQLRTFFNFKWAIIQQRYSKSIEHNDFQKKKEFEILNNDFSSLFTKYVPLLKELGVKEENPNLKITSIMKTIDLKKPSHEIVILKKLKKYNAALWNKLHIISEHKITNLKLLKTLLRIAEMLCEVEAAFSKPFLSFYLELKISYLHLEKDVLLLLLCRREGLAENNEKVLISEW